MKIESSATDEKKIAVPELPTFAEVLQARKRIKGQLPRTPMFHYPVLDHLIGATVYVKHENTQPTGCFKVRGGLNFMQQLSKADRDHGVITASTGNHAQSVAYAARHFGVKAQVVMPQGANPNKVAAVEALGAEVLLMGKDFDASRQEAQRLADQEQLRYVDPVDPALIAGVATETLEMLEDQPKLSAIFVPVGSGTGAVGACIVKDALRPDLQLIAVQSDSSPAAHDSWRQGQVVSASNTTFAEGVATGVGFEFTQQRLRSSLTDFVLVQDDDISQAMIWLLRHAHTLSEGAGAASLAALYQQRERFQGQKVGIIVSGGNVEFQHLSRIISDMQLT